MGLPWLVKTLLPMQGAQVQVLVEKLRFPHVAWPNKQTKKGSMCLIITYDFSM